MSITKKKPSVMTVQKPVTVKKSEPTASKAVIRADRATDMKSEQTTLIVRRTILDNDGKVSKTAKDQSVINITPFSTNVAKVTVGSKVRKSDDNYGGTEVFVSLTVPCYVEEIDDVYAQVTEKVEKMVSAELEAAGIIDPSATEEEPELDTETAEDATEDADEEGALDEDGEADGDEEELTQEDIDAMSRADLVALIDNHGLDIDHKKIKSPDALKKAIKELISDDSEESEEVEEADDDLVEESEEEPTEEESADDSSYSRKDLESADLPTLKSIIDAWELKVKVSKDMNPKDRKKAYVEAIIKAQG